MRRLGIIELMKKKVFVILTILLGIYAIIIVLKDSLWLDAQVCKNCNVILITLTNLRYDHLSANGYFRPTSPNLDALAAESLVFDNAFSHSSWTLPEGISIYTSLYPYQHKIMNRSDGSTLSKTTPTLLDILKDNKYATAAFAGTFDYDPKFGLMDRVGSYQGCTHQTYTNSILGYGKLDCAIPKALKWIKNNQDNKFFVHIQGFDTHCPFSQKGGLVYDPDYKGKIDFSKCLWTFKKTEPQIINGKKFFPIFSPLEDGRMSVLLDENDVNHLIALYDESITNSDALIGSFLSEIKSMGLDKNTIIIFASEHGDMFGKYGRFMRGGPVSGTFYDDVLHTPLFIKNPRIDPKRIDGLVQQIDISPTLLDFLGLPKNSNFMGKSLIPLITQGEKINDYVFAGTEFYPDKDNLYITEYSRVETIRDKEWKLIKEQNISENSKPPTYELYNIVVDKEEQDNLAGSEEDIFNDLRAKLEAWSDKMLQTK